VKDLVFGTEDGTMTGKRLLNTKSRPHRNGGANWIMMGDEAIDRMFSLVDQEAALDDYPAKVIGNIRKRETAFGDGNALKIDRQCRRMPRKERE